MGRDNCHSRNIAPGVSASEAAPSAGWPRDVSGLGSPVNDGADSMIVGTEADAPGAFGSMMVWAEFTR